MCNKSNELRFSRATKSSRGSIFSSECLLFTFGVPTVSITVFGLRCIWSKKAKITWFKDHKPLDSPKTFSLASWLSATQSVWLEWFARQASAPVYAIMCDSLSVELHAGDWPHVEVNGEACQVLNLSEGTVRI